MNDNGTREGVVATGDPVLDDLLARYEEVTAGLADYDQQGLVRMDRPSTGLLCAAQAVERGRRRLSMYDAHYVEALEAGGEPARHAASSTTAFLCQQLRLSHREARVRVELSHACRSDDRVSADGSVGETPEDNRSGRCLALTEAVREGAVSLDHAAFVVGALAKFPEQVSTEVLTSAEADLVATARQLPPKAVAVRARQLLEAADPVGAMRDVEYRFVQRTGFLVGRPGGGARLEADLDDETAEKWQTMLGPLLKPMPEGPDGKDERSPGQRFVDALGAVADRVLNSGDLPACGGTPATMVISLTTDQLRTREGFAVTENGNRIPVLAALRMADQCAIYALFRDAKGVPLSLGRDARLASAGQTVALAARDLGCSFPGCDRPPSWCQRHHVIDWIDDGETELDNLTLVCGYHHREFKKRGWECQIVDGLPWWRPPRWIDPGRAPVLNRRIASMA